MHKISDFDTASIQATLFTPGLSFVPSKILASSLDKWGDTFDGTPISLPSPPEMPTEIPRVILESDDKRYKIEFSPARVNLFWLRMEDTDKINVPDFLHFSTVVLCDYIVIVNGTVGRIAAIVTRFLKEANPGKVLSEHFCREKWLARPFDRPQSFEIHAHKRYVLADKYRINSWVRCKTGLLGKKPNQEPIILVEQDLNTLPEETETREFSDVEIKDFFRRAGREFDSILSLYFPLEE